MRTVLIYHSTTTTTPTQKQNASFNTSSCYSHSTLLTNLSTLYIILHRCTIYNVIYHNNNSSLQIFWSLQVHNTNNHQHSIVMFYPIKIKSLNITIWFRALLHSFSSSAIKINQMYQRSLIGQFIQVLHLPLNCEKQYYYKNFRVLKIFPIKLFNKISENYRKNIFSSLVHSLYPLQLCLTFPQKSQNITTFSKNKTLHTCLHPQLFKKLFYCQITFLIFILTIIITIFQDDQFKQKNCIHIHSYHHSDNKRG